MSGANVNPCVAQSGEEPGLDSRLTNECGFRRRTMLILIASERTTVLSLEAIAFHG